MSNGEATYQEIKRRLDQWETFEKALRRIARAGQDDEGSPIEKMALYAIQAKLIARDALGIPDDDGAAA